MFPNLCGNQQTLQEPPRPSARLGKPPESQRIPGFARNAYVEARSMD